jgi:signal transduction histidine kinase
MIDHAKKKLSIKFSSVIIIFPAFVLMICYFFFHESLLEGVKRHMGEDIRKEFVYYFEQYGLDTSSRLWGVYHFEVLNEHGEVLVANLGSSHFYPKLNRDLLRNAFAGNKGFETLLINDEPHLILYFPLNEKYAGRIATSISEEKKYEAYVLNLMLLILLVFLLASILVSWYLVSQAMKPVSSLFAFQESLSSNISHELRSPLASLKGNLEVSLRKERTTEEYKELVRLSLSEVDRIIGLLNDLHMLASSKFKPLDLYREVVNVTKILHEVTNLYGPRMASKKIKFRQTIREHIISVCDEGLIRRVIENLMNNALKYTPEGATIEVLAFKVPGTMFITLSNTCNSVSKEEVAHLFKPYYRGLNTSHQKIEGKGLGLFIARYIARSHGGDIVAKPTRDGMLSFIFSLPLKPKPVKRNVEEYRAV